MAKYRNPLTGQIEEITNPGLNPELVAGRTPVPESTPLGIITPESLALEVPIGYKNPNVNFFGDFPTPVEPTKVETPQTDAVSKMIADLTASSGLAGEKAGYQIEQEKAAGLVEMKKSETDYTYQYKQLEAEFKNLQIESQKAQYKIAEEFTGRAGTTQQARMTEAEQRKITLKSLDVSSKANTVTALLLGQQGLISSAQTAIDKAVSDKYGVREADRKAKIENLALLLQDPKIDQETKDRAAATAARIKAEGVADDKKKADMKTIGDWAVDIAGKVATDKTIPPGLANQIMQIANSENPDVNAAFKLYSPYVAKKETTFKTQMVGDNLIEYELDAQGKIKSQRIVSTKGIEGISDSVNKVLSGEFGDIIKSAANLVGAERGKTSKASIAQSIADNDFVSAYAQIANNVEESLAGTSKTKFADTRTDYSVMLGLKEAVQKYAEGGGNMGLLTGKEEDIKRKLGIDSGKASALAVQLWREFQTYRVNMTGAAFSEAESRDYAAVNPTLGKSLNLNLSVIEGALNQMENRITSTINTRVPNAKKLYQKVGLNQDGLSDDDAYQEYLKSTGQDIYKFSPTGQ